MSCPHCNMNYLIWNDITVSCYVGFVLCVYDVSCHEKQHCMAIINLYDELSSFVQNISLLFQKVYLNSDKSMLHTRVTCQDLTHLSLDKMSAVSQTIFSDAFSWMKIFVFWLRFHWILFLMVQLTIAQHWFRYWLAPNRRQSIIWTNADTIQRRIYATVGGDVGPTPKVDCSYKCWHKTQYTISPFLLWML